MTKKKPFAELTERGQQNRLKKYAALREERGTKEALVRLVRDPRITDTKDKSARIAFFRVAEYDKETNKTEFFNVSAYIAKGKESLEAFYASLKKSDLIALEYKQNGKYNNAYNIMDRREADARLKAERKANRATNVDAANASDIDM